MVGSAPHKTGIGRSLDVYFRDRDRACRMHALNAEFVSRGALAFDIGAHIGDRTASFLQLGARVVALEPQPRVFRALRLIHGRASRAVLLPWAVGREDGEITLHLNSTNPTVSTVAPEFIANGAKSRLWTGQVWDGRVTVPMTTLDALIGRFGTPEFVKIDVEGHEAEVIAGLSIALKALSFEFTTIQRGVAYKCLEHLQNLGRYEFNGSLGEEHRLQTNNWVDAKTIREWIDDLPEAANSGDVYARLM
ncbi:MAG: FkbM family methyltransferase [Pseudomonadota bacterium]